MRTRRAGLFMLAGILACLSAPAAQKDLRDGDHRPDKVMDIAGLTAGMTVGEVGAGEGYFTFKLAARVGPSGRVYANDIDARALGRLADRARREGFSNIETIVGEVDDPLLPPALDAVGCAPRQGLCGPGASVRASPI